MTVRQLFEYLLIELNKVQAPSLLLEDFNYFGNKVITQYINKTYNFYDINQQKTDDLRVLKSTAVLTPTISRNYSTTSLLNKTYEVNLPDDYLHILNCIIEYTLARSYQCYVAGDKIQFGAKRLTADMFPQLINNYYMKPKYNNPYFYINNNASDTTYPINETPVSIVPNISSSIITFSNAPVTTYLVIIKDGITYTFTYNASTEGPFYFSTIESLQSVLEDIGITSTIDSNDLILSNTYNENISSISSGNSTYLTVTSTTLPTTTFISRVAGYRYGNKSKVRMEIRYGNNNTTFVPTKVYIDYLRSPQFIQLTQDQIDSVDDVSQILEFPDYVCQEIINDFVKLLLENASDPRLQTNIPVNQSIAGLQQQK